VRFFSSDVRASNPRIPALMRIFIACEALRCNFYLFSSLRGV
jgi:hypothetical protein